jgi:type VI secretion system secreted protein VgrG
LVAVKLQGHEGIDSLFEYHLTLKTPDARNHSSSQAADYNLDEFIGKEINVEIELADEAGGKREINALVVEARFLREEGRNAFYELTLKPWLYLATLTTDCKVFQDRTVVELLEELLSDYGYPVEKRLTGDYPKRDYQTQYNETDYEFFVRLCEEWGISYFFEHEGVAQRLILADEISAYRKNPNARYQTLKFHFPDEQIEEEYIDAFVPLRRIASGCYISRDYDYTRPKADLTVPQAHPRETAENDYEVFAWHAGQSGGSHYVQPKAGPNQATNEPITEGSRLALLRMQALSSPGWRAKGGGNARGLVPGNTFTLIEHPAAAANLDYLTLETVLLVEEIAQETQKAGAQGDKGKRHADSSAATQKVWLRKQQWQVRVDFEVHPLKEAYRPAPTQKKPIVPGPETALVVGPEGENLWTDELGRIKVQFYWDRSGQKNGHSSCWIRVSSPWAGNQLGALQLPRIGQEVIVSYLGGDPDLPVCTGRVHNQDNLPPWQLPGQQALSGLRSRELVEGGGNAASGQSNALVMDDTAGQIQAKLRSDHLGSELSLGYITRVEDHAGRKDGRGEGFDLRTDGHGVVRSAAGLYLTTESRLNAQGPMKGMEESVQRLEHAKAQQQTLAEVADTYEADFGEQAKVAEKLQKANAKIRGEGETDEKAGEFPELEEAHLFLSSAQGIHSTSARSTHLTAGDHLALSSGEHLSISVGKRLLASVTDGIRYFVRQAGMKFIAAADDIDIKALKDNLNLFARLNIQHDANKIILKAKEEILLIGGGSYIKINGGTIENGTSGTWVAHAGTHLFASPKTMSAALPGLPKVGDGELELLDKYKKPFGLKGAPYKVVDVLGKTVTGVLDGSGQSFASGLALGPAKVFFGMDPINTWDMNVSYVKVQEWPMRELEEVADVGAFGTALKDQPPASIKTVLDKATGEIGGKLSKLDDLVPTIEQLGTLVPLGGDLDKLSGLGGMGDLITGASDTLSGFSSQLPGIAGRSEIPVGISALLKNDALKNLSGTGHVGDIAQSSLGDFVPALSGVLPVPTSPPLDGAIFL